MLPNLVKSFRPDGQSASKLFKKLLQQIKLYLRPAQAHSNLVCDVLLRLQLNVLEKFAYAQKSMAKLLQSCFVAHSICLPYAAAASAAVAVAVAAAAVWQVWLMQEH